MLFVIPLVQRLALPETLQTMRGAIEPRKREAEALYLGQEWFGAIYLYGYVAEMLLKTATCLVDLGFPSTTTVESKFAPAKKLWRIANPGLPLPPNTLHNLPFWSEVLQEERQAQSKMQLPGLEAAMLSRHVLTLNAYWTVEMRYQDIGATAEDAALVRDAVNWIHQNHATLWR